MPAIRIFNDDDVRRIKYLFEERDLNLKQIGEIMHCSPSSVRKYLVDAGVDVNHRHSWRPHTAEKDEIDVIDFLYWGLGLSTLEVADALGVTQKTVHRRMIRHGIPRRSYQAARVLREKKYSYSDEYRQACSEQMKEQWRTGNLKVGRHSYENMMHVNPDDFQEAA